MKTLLSKARNRLVSFVEKRRHHPSIRRYLQFNRRKWPQPGRGSRDSVVLIGLLASNPSIFCYSYVTNYLARKNNSRIESFQFVGHIDPTLKEIFASFGARFALSIAAAEKHEKQIQAHAAEILRGLKSNWDVVNIAVDGVLIGDQIYDSYLRFFNEPTVRLDDERFKNVVVQALRIFYATRDYLQRTKVTAFVAHDFSYINSGIITRLMYRAGVPIYMILFGEPFFLLQLDPEPSGASHGFPPPFAVPYYAYPRIFAKLSADEQAAGRESARHALEARLTGTFCPLVMMPETTYAVSNQRVLADDSTPRILIMMHDFIDSPHGYRDMPFPDYLEWVTFLLERAEKTPFRWYVKPHPCSAEASRTAMNLANDRVVETLKERFPKVTFLPAATSNQQILSDGVSAMFTMHGSAGHEYAYRGVPVVNCGDNPHIAYNFNIHAHTLEQFERCIFEADRLSVRIDKNEIEEFFFMHYFFLKKRFGSPVNLIDKQIFESPDWVSRIDQPSIFDEFMAGATPERERGIAEYFDRYFSNPTP